WTLLATGSDDRTVRLWDLATGAEQRRLVTTTPVRALCVATGSTSPGPFLAIAGASGLAVLDIDTGVALTRSPPRPATSLTAGGERAIGGCRTGGSTASGAVVERMPIEAARPR